MTDHPVMQANFKTLDSWHRVHGHFYGNGCNIEPACEPLVKHVAVPKEQGSIHLNGPFDTICSCGQDFKSLCQFWKHQAQAYEELINEYSKTT